MRPRIPDELAEDVDEIVDDSSYRSATEFIIDATRRRVDEY